MKCIEISEILFTGKRSLPWKDVEQYLLKYAGTSAIVTETGDIIKIGSYFASECCGSEYTQKLHGTLEKAKANVSQIIVELLESATNRRWVENKNKKHTNDAKGGWYRYDVFLGCQLFLPVKNLGMITGELSLSE